MQQISQWVRHALMVALLLFCPRAMGWGQGGHEAVGLAAQQLLTDGAKAEAGRLLGQGISLDQVANWADEIRGGRRETAPWHYVTIQVGEGGYDSLKAPKPNVVTATLEQTALLRDTGTAPLLRGEALRWLVHLVGDLHQPLHVGEKRDRGGNEVKIRFKRRAYKLHEFWDWTLLEAREPETRGLGMGLLRDLQAQAGSKQGLGPRAGGGVVDWVNETHAMTAACYRIGKNTVAPDRILSVTSDYEKAALSTMRERLATASLRLAILLNQTLDPEGFLKAGGVKGLEERLRALPPAALEGPVQERPGRERPGRVADEKAGRAPDSAKADSGKIPPGEEKAVYAWSRHGRVYHYTECADAKRIRPENLQQGSAPPKGRGLHPGCPRP